MVKAHDRHTDVPSCYLRETRYLDYSHPALQTLIRRVSEDFATDSERAVALHDFVRDQVEFGFTRRMYDVKASDVLLSRRGFCVPKATLLTALLRGAGIPARQRFVGLSAAVLDGVLDPGTRFVDHALVEVWLHQRWVRIDSFIVDPLLFHAGTQQLAGSIGLGIRRDGSCRWDGINDSFVQYHPDFTITDFGVYHDVQRFYREAPRTYSRLGWLTRWIAGPRLARANDRLQRLRRQAA